MSKNFINRTLAASIEKTSLSFPIVMLTGPRQVGKTTLLQEIQKNTRTYISLDDLNARSIAKKDPAGFLQRHKPPILIDEVQYAPELFPYIKIAADKTKKPGMFWLTGSQQFVLMKNISESLAGRVVILKLQGISLAEEVKQAEYSTPFIPKSKELLKQQKTIKPLSLLEVYYKIWRGSFPFMVKDDGTNWEHFYESYIATYIQRDVRDYIQVNNEDLFLKFLQVAAARSGQLINYTDFARDVGVSEPTIKSWITVLRASGLIYILQPYFNNLTKRFIKTPKLYFLDTGLCAYLTGWSNYEVLEKGAMSGAILETYVISEILKSYFHNGKTPRIYFYRDKEKREVDLLIENNGKLYPIEIKKTATPCNEKLKNFTALKNINIPIAHGGLICFTDSLIPLSSEVDAIPVSYI